MKQTDYRWRCTKCGRVSPGDTKRCPVCDALLALHGEVLYNEPEPDLPVRPVEVEVIEEQEAVTEKPKKEKKEKQKKKTERKQPVFSKGLLIGLCALLAIAVLAAVLPQLLDNSSHNAQLRDPAPPATASKRSWEDNILMADSMPKGVTNSESFYAYQTFKQNYDRSDILSITFLDSLASAPADSWDVSERQDGSVLAWVVKNGELYDLYIAGEGGVRAPADCSELFKYYFNVQQINFNNCFHTEYVTNMEHMFWLCADLTAIDCSDFDTSGVTDMRGMFRECINLASLNLSGWDTSNVKDMGIMFLNCEALTRLNLSDLDTSNVIWMSGMFDGCEALTSLNLSGRFDTSNVIAMWRMFAGCLKLEELDISGFDTSKVKQMIEMFEGCSALKNLDLGVFDTSSVTQYEGFMDGDTLPDGRPWIELFEKNETLALRHTDITLTKIGETYTMEITGKIKNDQVTWTSSNKEIVNVDANGKVTCLKWGTATITASYNGQEVKCTVRCTQK